MGGLFRLILIVLVLAGGYWAYYIFMSKDAYDSIGVTINAHLPAAAREYGCAELRKRHAADVAEPEGCQGLWPAKL
ncbi:MAG TPA: hypothetical protein VLA00_16710 [Xanthobacteraceae bacterium]|nr:hypothetical protein [Xanthobacteraceae bacterium]